MDVHVNIEAVTAAGVLIRTFGDPKQARAWAQKHRDVYPGMDLMEVTTTVTRRRLRTAALRVVA